MYEVTAVATVKFGVPNVNCAEHAVNRVQKMLREGTPEGIIWRMKSDYDADVASMDVDIDYNTVECTGGPSFSPHDKRKLMKALSDVGFTDEQIDRVMDDGVGD